MAKQHLMQGRDRPAVHNPIPCLGRYCNGIMAILNYLHSSQLFGNLVQSSDISLDSTISSFACSVRLLFNYFVMVTFSMCICISLPLESASVTCKGLCKASHLLH